MTRALRSSRDIESWPVILVLLGVLVPTACLLWFMAAAMRNEHLATRQQLADAYRVHLSASQIRLRQHWTEAAITVGRTSATNESAPQAFRNAVQSGLVDSVVLFDERGGVLYPNMSVATNSDLSEREMKWQEAGRLEYLGKHIEAAASFAAIARAATNSSSVARAVQAQARCLVRAGQRDSVIELVEKTFGDPRFDAVTDPQGRLIAANSELMALELATNQASPSFHNLARRLGARLNDYGNPMLAAPQRLFLMKEARALSPKAFEFPTLLAEELAAEAVRSRARETLSAALQRGGTSNVWQFATENGQTLALITSERLFAFARRVIDSEPTPSDVEIALLPPDREAFDALVVVPVGDQMPQWRLALSFRDRKFTEGLAKRQVVFYVWGGVIAMIVTGTLAWLTLRMVRRQMALARLKNDLAATVSHELKTPLAAMRVFIDTLLDSDTLDPVKTREYLELIARENERLGRLIQNFLTFSRLEQKKQAFHFSAVSAGDVIEAALESLRSRLDTTGCRIEVQIEDDLPLILADADAIATALINLMENAHKYSGEIKQIDLRAKRAGNSVTFSVTDNGLGISPRDQRRIFQPFFQVDQSLVRRGGGCGLGLSIVQFIVSAHEGRVALDSQPGRGSTFSISIPVASKNTSIPEEAIA